MKKKEEILTMKALEERYRKLPLEEVQNLLEAGTRLFFEEMYQPTEAAKVRARILSRRLSILLVCYRIKSTPLARSEAERLERMKHDWSC